MKTVFFFLKPKFFKEQYFWLRIIENVLTQFPITCFVYLFATMQQVIFLPVSDDKCIFEYACRSAHRNDLNFSDRNYTHYRDS